MDKLKALAVIFACAQEYQNNLAGRNLLFLCTNKHKKIFSVEVTFDASNFLHMTGLKVDKSNLSALEFYHKCLDRRLKVSEFEFADDGTTPLKLRILPGLVRKNLSAKMIGDYNMSKPKLYTDKIAGGIKACIGFVQHKGYGRYIPNTVLEGDIRLKTIHADRIIVTYRKYRNEAKYTEIVYAAKGVEWDTLELSEEYQYLTLPK